MANVAEVYVSSSKINGESEARFSGPHTRDSVCSYSSALAVIAEFSLDHSTVSGLGALNVTVNSPTSEVTPHFYHLSAESKDDSNDVGQSLEAVKEPEIHGSGFSLLVFRLH